MVYRHARIRAVIGVADRALRQRAVQHLVGNRQFAERLSRVRMVRSRTSPRQKSFARVRQPSPNEFGKMIKLQPAENQIGDRLRSLPSATQRFGPADRRHRNTSSNAGSRAALGSGGRRVLLNRTTPLYPSAPPKAPSANASPKTPILTLNCVGRGSFHPPRGGWSTTFRRSRECLCRSGLGTMKRFSHDVG